jgi:hypothetical protein
MTLGDATRTLAEPTSQLVVRHEPTQSISNRYRVPVDVETSSAER